MNLELFTKMAIVKRHGLHKHTHRNSNQTKFHYNNFATFWMTHKYIHYKWQQKIDKSKKKPTQHTPAQQ